LKYKDSVNVRIRSFNWIAGGYIEKEYCQVRDAGFDQKVIKFIDVISTHL